jgi:hypothetical protein
MAAKKKRSAKQKANDKRLGKMAKARGKKSTPKTKTKKRSRIVSKVKSVVKRKTNKGGKKRTNVKTSLKSITGSKTLQKVALGVGGGLIATQLVNRFMPSSSLSKLAAPGAALALGGIEGLIGQFALNMFSTPGGNSNVQPQMEAL